MRQCIVAANSVFDTLGVDLLCVLDHANITRMKWADEVTRRGSIFDSATVSAVNNPLATVKGGLYSDYLIQMIKAYYLD